MKKISRIFCALIVVASLALAGSSRGYAQNTDPGDTAKVTMIEYSDYECPACGYYYPIVEALKKKFGDRLKIVYHYFPLNSHQYSFLAARAAQAAKNQGKFKAMHDLLFKHQGKWSTSGNPQSIFIDYAKQIGLDVDEFKDDLNSAETQKIVMESKKKGESLGIHSTPTFFINGEMVEQMPRTESDFEALINSYISEAN